jgi:plastocyanin
VKLGTSSKPEDSLPITTPSSVNVREDQMKLKTKFKLLVGCLMLGGATYAVAQGNPPSRDNSPHLAQVVALDECDPKTFNDALGADFCKNIALGSVTTLSELFSEAQSGHPDPNWDFEPDTVHMKAGTTLSVVDQGGEPHTFTEVKHFGGGFIPQLNGPGEKVIPECEGGFGEVAVARTRILQGSNVNITDLSKGEHRFQCCIHPWMRVKVEVK